MYSLAWLVVHPVFQARNLGVNLDLSLSLIPILSRPLTDMTTYVS